MADNFNWGAIVNFGTQNADTVEKSLKFVQDLVVALGESGKISEKTMRSLFRSIETQSKRAAEGVRDVSGAMSDFEKSSTSASSKVSKEFKALGDRVSHVSDQLRQAAQEIAASGEMPTLELQMEFSGITQEQIEEAKLYFEAQKAGAREATQELDRQSKEQQQVTQQQNIIYRKYLDDQQAHEEKVRSEQSKIYRNYLDQQQAAAKAAHDRSVSDLRKQLDREVKEYEAQQERIREIQGGRDYSNLSVNIDAGVDARQKEAQAWSDVVKARMSDQVATEKQAGAQANLNSTLQDNINGLPRLRYAMYDVAQTTGILTTAIGGLATGLITASAQYETAFTAVERTSGVTGDAVQSLRDDFLELAREIPQTFAEIANIGARGAQLGIATDQLQDFTEVVAQFVATSDTVTLDQAVEAFGRISNLLGDTDFNRIGSAITLVGVNAAATEAQIIKTTQELAPFATAVGMSTEGVIALATALGSLGQPPERARSAFLTLQRVMDNAIASGSDNLYAFANLLNKTAEETAALWQQDPDAFITAFARSLGSVENLTTAFADLGINERRAVQVFQALAADARNAGGELSVLEQAMQDSAQGYAEGTELARQYGLIVDDLASKWQIFKNSVMELSATLGDVFAPIAKQTLDIISTVIQFLTEASKNPAGRAFIRLVGAIAGVTFVVGTLVTVLALSLASIAAMRTALDGLSRSSVGSTLTLRSLRGEVAALAGTVQGGTTALRLFRGAMVLTGIGAAITLVGSLAYAFTDLGESVEDTFNRFISSTGGLAEALAEDAELFEQLGDIDLAGTGLEEMFTELPTLIDDTTGAVLDNTEAFEAAQEVLGLLPSSVDNASRAIEDQTIVLGANARAWLANSLLTSQAFQELMGNAQFVEAWRQTGADFNAMIDAAASDGVQGVYNYYNSLGSATEEAAGFYATGLQKTFIAIENGFKVFAQGLSNAWNSLMAGDFSGAWSSFMDSSMAGLVGAFTQLGTPLSRTSREMASLATGAVATAQSVKSLAGGVQDILEDFEDWGSELDDTGGALSGVRDEIRTVLDYASDLQGVFSRSFDLRFGVSIAQDSTANMLQKLRDEAEAARESIRDLQGSLRDLRGELGLIDADISKTQYFLSIAIEYGDTRRAEQLQAQLTKLEADRAKTQEDLRKTQDDLTSAEESNSKAVQGNTQAARDNRAALRDLFQSYQAQITAAAESGASQQDLERLSESLRQEFVRQATQLGYNRSDLKNYEEAFYDVSTAIRNVPRNVTVEIHGLGPAQAALREYETRIRNTMNNARNTVGRGIDIPLRVSTAGSGPALRVIDLVAEIQRLQSYVNSASASISTARTQQVIGALRAELRGLVGYSSGGYTGRGGKYEPAGVVHRGEYVVPKHMVNQSTGLPYADALGRLVKGTPSPAGYANGGFVRPTSSSVYGNSVALTPGTIQAIAQAVKPHIQIGDRMVGESAARSNAMESYSGVY